MIQAVTIIGTGFANLGLIGAGVGIGVILDAGFLLAKSPEERAAAIAELNKKIGVYKENDEEHHKVDEQNTLDGDQDSPNESSSAEELEQ
jgi:hypothetical protein